jgi:hypothetical protein
VLSEFKFLSNLSILLVCALILAISCSLGAMSFFNSLILSALSSVNALLKSEKSEMLAADHEPFGPVAQTYTCLFDFLNNNSLVVDNESGRIGENGDVW